MKSDLRGEDASMAEGKEMGEARSGNEGETRVKGSSGPRPSLHLSSV